MLAKARWAIVGSHGRNPICDKLYDKLLRGQKKVFRVNPSQPSPTTGILSSLRAIGAQLEAMRETTPRGGRTWAAASVKSLLDRARVQGLFDREDRAAAK